MANSGAPLVEVDRANRQRSSLSSSPTSSTSSGISVPPRQQVARRGRAGPGRRPASARTRRRRGTPTWAGKPIVYVYAGARRIARRRRAGPARRRSRPSRSSTRSSRRAGCGSRAAPPRADRTGRTAAVPSPPVHVPVPVLPPLDRLPPARDRRHRAMINLGFWQLRRLDERKAFNAQVSEPHRPAAGSRSTTCSCAGADPDDRRVALGRRPPGTYLPDEQFVVVNRSQDGIAGDDGRHAAAARRRPPAARRAGLRAARRRRPPAAPTGTVEVVGRLRPVAGAPHAASSATRRRASCTEAQRLDIPRLTAQLPGAAGADVRRADGVATGRGRRRTRQPVDAARADRGAAPLLRRAVVHLLRSPSVVGWVLAVRKSLRTRRRGGSTTSRRRIARGSRRSTAVIVRVTSPGEASMRRYGAQTSTGQVEEGVEERRQLVLVEAQQHLQAVGVQPAGAAQRRAATRRRQTRPAIGPRRDATGRAIAAATRGAARSEAATEKPVAGWA